MDLSSAPKLVFEGRCVFSFFGPAQVYVPVEMRVVDSDNVKNLLSKNGYMFYMQTNRR